MKKSKKWIALFLATLCTFTPLTAFAADVNIDRKPLQMDVSPTVINGRTMVPMRSIFEGLGAAVEWNSYTRGITAQKEDKTITLYLNETTAFINGVSHSLDTPAVAVNGRTMVPVRFVAESLDCKVYWDSYNQLVSIFTDNADAAAYAAELQKQQAARKAEEERLAAQRAAQKAEQERLAAQNKNTQTVSKKSTTVYVTPTGKRYHYSGSCNGGTYIASTLEKALARGLTPCKKCVG